jgi:tRNA A-37 threonylcarbamoyl transferase component Bud32
VSATQDKRLFAPQRWSQVRSLLDCIDGLDAAAQARELDRVGAGDPELASAARALLEPTRQFGAHESLLAAVDRLSGEPSDKIPTRVGPFRPVRRIGAGGMGVVYLAERDGADFTQRVALKLLEGDAARTARFASRERRILAALAHPNITAFVDAGNDDDHTWLAMEYVDGQPLLEFCHRRSLSTAARVALFTQVCSAVAHAHAQLVVHRDLKPSNVLVSNDGVAKLLDFGIAQMIDSSEDRAPATRVFTPEYAAPEQLRGEHTTTASDVYSLGLMLYELITLRRLPTIERRNDADWTTGELARLVTTQPAADSDAPARAADDLRVLGRELRGDLGRIIAHAIAAAPAQRYASVTLLRADLTRWLEHRPLSIARPTLRYVVARFVRRHRLAVATAAIAVAALIAISVVALWQARRAQQMAARADHARVFIAELLANTDPFAAKHSGRNTAELLREGAQRLDKEFADAPDIQADLRSTIASILDRVGDPAHARDLMQRSVEQLGQVYGPRSPKVGAALNLLAIAREDTGDLDGAHDDFSAAQEILQGSGPEYAGARIEAVTGLAKLANLRGDHADAERMHRAVLAERQANEGPESADIAMDLMNLAADSLYAERFSQAEELAQRARAMLERTVGPRHARTIYVDNVLGLAQAATGNTQASIATLRGAAELARATLQPGAVMIGNVLSSLGHAQYLAGDLEAAVATLTEAHTLNEAAKNPRRSATATLLGLAQLRTGRPEALATLRDARDSMTAQKGNNDPLIAMWCQAAYAAALAAGGDLVQGEQLAREARATLLAGPNSKSVRLGEIDDLLADVLDRNANPDEGRAMREEALATFRRIYGEDHPRTRATVERLGANGVVKPH